jgi:hypothetical protein
MYGRLTLCTPITTLAAQLDLADLPAWIPPSGTVFLRNVVFADIRGMTS